MGPLVAQPVEAALTGRPHPITGAPAAARTAWTCPACAAAQPLAVAREQLFVCPTCAHHARIGARQRIEHLADPDSFAEWDADLAGRDRLAFVDTRPYAERLAEAQARHRMPDALLSGAAAIGGHRVGLAAFDFSFMGGSLSAAVGERLARAAERCATLRTPFVCVTTSGGARMQEGVFSLLQMAKSVAALHTLADAHMPFISILADPTMGGSIASFAALGDVIVAEPRATIGFTGARVIAQVTHERLPADFQTSEFHHARGLIDMVVDRRQLKGRVIGLLRVLAAPGGRAGTDASAA